MYRRAVTQGEVSTTVRSVVMTKTRTSRWLMVGGLVDHFDGNLDNIRFSDVALTPAQFIQVPEPSALALLGLGGLALFARPRRSQN